MPPPAHRLKDNESITGIQFGAARWRFTYFTCKLNRVVMKQNITLALDKHILKAARAFAARRGTSVSAMLADELRKIVAEDTLYERAKAKALARLSSPFRLGGAKAANREALHDRS
jgi:hypothetical protein